MTNENKIAQDAKAWVDKFFEDEVAPEPTHDFLKESLAYHYKALTSKVQDSEDEKRILDTAEYYGFEFIDIKEEDLQTILRIGANSLQQLLHILSEVYDQHFIDYIQAPSYDLMDEYFVTIASAFNDEDDMEALTREASDMTLCNDYKEKGGNMVFPAFTLHFWIQKYYYKILGMVIDHEVVVDVMDFARINRKAKRYLDIIVEVLMMLHQKLKEE